MVTKKTDQAPLLNKASLLGCEYTLYRPRSNCVASNVSFATFYIIIASFFVQYAKSRLHIDTKEQALSFNPFNV